MKEEKMHKNQCTFSSIPQTKNNIGTKADLLHSEISHIQFSCLNEEKKRHFTRISISNALFASQTQIAQVQQQIYGETYVL